ATSRRASYRSAREWPNLRHPVGNSLRATARTHRRDKQPPSARAEDGIRTRDPNLGKIVRYHCATSARRGLRIPNVADTAKPTAASALATPNAAQPPPKQVAAACG